MPHHKIMQLKIFQRVRENLAKIHFGADKNWFDFEILLNILKCKIALGLQCAYLFRVANTPEDLMNAIFTTNIGILVFISYLHIITKMVDIYFVMDKIEKIVNKSKLNKLIFNVSMTMTSILIK